MVKFCFFQLRDDKGRNKKFIVISKAQVRTVPVDFCTLRYESCQKCVESNGNTLFESSCYWQNNSCLSKNELKDSEFVDSIEICSLLTKPTSTFTTTVSIVTMKSNITTALLNETTTPQAVINVSRNFYLKLFNAKM